MKKLGKVLREKDKDKIKTKLTITNCYPIRKDELNQIGEKFEYMDAEIPKYLKLDFPDIEIVSKNTLIVKRRDRDDDFGSLKWSRVECPKIQIKKCTNLFCRMVVNNKGELLRCSCGFARIIGIGNVHEENLYMLWKSDEQMNIAREHFIKGDCTPDICKGCLV